MNEQINLFPYSEEWSSLFESEKALLQEALLDTIASIHHVGSTAIPGMTAKPIIDILVESRVFPPDEGVISSLVSVGYTHMGECGVPGRHWFKKGVPRTHHIHLTPVGGKVAKSQLKFRDVLRSDPTLASEYAQLKHKLAETYKSDRDAYALNKTDFVNKVLRLDGG